MNASLRKQIIDYLENQRFLGEILFIENFNEVIDVDKTEDNKIQEEIGSGKYVKRKVKLQKESKKIKNDKSVTILNTDWQSAAELDVLHKRIVSCMQCGLGKMRTNLVFGDGNPNADIMIIGEAPGKDEDERGKPFIGRAGKLLTKIIESIDLKREDVYIANICKCRPPGNRAPLQDEVAACMPFLLRQIEIIKPVFILALGATAVGSLTGTKPVMAQARGKLTDFHEVQMLITYHPAALLYNPNLKRLVWEDMKLLKKLYDEYLSKKNIS
jgi:DNA polymerase